MTDTSNEIELTTVAFLYNGHPYAYTFDDMYNNDKAGGKLFDASGHQVAYYITPCLHDEYRYMHHTATGEVMCRQHENEKFERPIWEELAGQYEAHCPA